jgi:hypothetical protein
MGDAPIALGLPTQHSTQLSVGEIEHVMPGFEGFRNHEATVIGFTVVWIKDLNCSRFKQFYFRLLCLVFSVLEIRNALCNGVNYQGY